MDCIFEKSTKCTSVALLRLSPDLLGDSSSEKGPASKKIGRETQTKRKFIFRRESVDYGELKPARVAGDCAVVQVDSSRCRTHTAGGLEPNRIEVDQIQIQIQIKIQIQIQVYQIQIQC